MTNPVRLSEAARGVLMSSMSDASCGMTLGRTAAWVARMRQALAAPPEAEPSRAEPSRAEPSRAEPSRAEPKATVRRRPVKAFAPRPERTARWVGWFLAAGWSPRETAHLFDLDPGRVAGSAR